jgi:hypothetical protein
MAFFSTSGRVIAKPGGSGRLGWTRILLFVVTGFVFCEVLKVILEHFEYSQSVNFLIALGAIILIPAGLILAWVGLRQGLRIWLELRRHLRWYHLIWMLMFVSDFVWQQRSAQATEADPLSPSTWARIGPELVIGFVLLFGLARKKIDWPKSLFQGLLNAIVVFCVIGFISTLWSVYRPFSAYKSIEFLMDGAILATIIMSISDVAEFETFWNFAWILSGATLLWVWCGLIFWPSEALQPVPESDDPVPRLQGVIPVIGYNAVGVTGAILALIALARLFPFGRAKVKNGAWYLGIFIFGFASMFMAQTRSAIAGFGLAAVLILLLAGRFYLLMGAGAVGLATLLVTPLGPLAWDFVSRAQSAQQLESLSGRTDWWAYGFEIWQQHPYTGVGMWAAGKFAVLEVVSKGDTPTLHSDWLEIFVGTSVWGLFPVIFLVLACWWLLMHFVFNKEFSLAERQLAMEAIGVLMILTVRSFFNVELVWHSPSNFFPVVGYAEYLRRRWRSMRMERESKVAALAFAGD